jgi:predicted NBD/HSP70 family sugar kinase
MAPRDATSLVAVHRELRRRCTATSPTLERFFAASKQSMAARFDRLEELGAAEVVPDGFRDRAQLWRVRRDMAFVLTISVQRTAIVAQAFDMQYLPVGEQATVDVEWDSRDPADPASHTGGEKLVDSLIEVGRAAMANAEAEEADRPDPLHGVDPLPLRERMLGVTLAVPTPVYRVRIREGAETRWDMRSASRWIMPELRDISEEADLHEVLRSKLIEAGLPANRLAVINDASAATLGTVVDIRIEGKRRPPRDMVLLWMAEGVGGGIISGHRLISGNAGFGGEFGHLAVRPDGILCRHCGVRGCLETIASSGALKRELRSAFEDSGLGATYGWPDRRPIVKIGDELRPHPAYTEAMREAGWWTGIALAQIVNILNPQLIVLADQHDPSLSIDELKDPAPVRDEQFKRSLEAALRRNSLDPAYRHVMGQTGERDIYGVQFGLHPSEPNLVNLTAERSPILPMIGAAADMVDTFSEDFFNSRLTESHVSTPRGRG